MAPASPSLPPYAHITSEAVQCIADASVRYEVPELLLHAILRKENGRMGQAVRNKNGSFDVGFAQINTAWVSHFAKFGVRLEHLMYDTCTNVQAAAYILKDNANKFQGDWFKATVAYNIGPYNWSSSRYAVGYRYSSDVVKYWWGFQNWVDSNKSAHGLSLSGYAALKPVASAKPATPLEQIVSTPTSSSGEPSSETL